MFRPRSRPLLWLTVAVLFAPGLARANGADPLPPPDELGPYAVGRVTFEVIDATREDRSLQVDVWYPVDADDAVGVDASAYDLVFAQLPSEVSLDGPPVSADGPFPLVAFSHGNNGIRFQSLFLMETLASHGFVVAAPDHSGNTALDLIGIPPPFEVRDRPLDISFVITRMLARNADAADPFFGTMDAERIGVMGHSFGGFTTMAVASGFADVLADPRVKVLVPISPAVGGLTDEQLGSIDLPELVLGGTLDITVPLVPSNDRAFELPTSVPRYRMDILEAGHNSFTNICDFFDVLVDAGLPQNVLEFILGSADEGCGPELIDIGEAQRLTNLYVVAFLRNELADDTRYRRFLTPPFAQDLPVAFFVAAGQFVCGLGPEMVVVLPPLLWWRRRRHGAAA